MVKGMSVASLLCLSVGVVACGASSSEGTGSSSEAVSGGNGSAAVVFAWETNTTTALANDKYGPNQPVGQGYRHIAMTWVAMFEAANAIRPRYKPYALSLNAPRDASQEAAVAAAAHYVLSQFFGATGTPNQSADLDAKYAASLAAIPDGQAKTDGIAVGEAAGQGIIALRANDNSSTVVTYTAPPTPGIWRPTPPGFAPPMTPGWGNVTPWVLASGSQFRPGAPSPLASNLRAAYVNEVKAYGALDSTARTPAQTTTAQYWASNDFQIETPLMITLLSAANYDLLDSARIGALVALAKADSVIAGFDAKYTYDEWRPVTHIQQADSVGNPNVVQDPTWLPLLITPPFPDYVAQHGVLEGSFGRVMKHFSPLHNVSNTSPGAVSSGGAFMSNPSGPPVAIGPQTLTFSSWRDLEENVIDARVLGGVHLRESDIAGVAVGIEIGRYTLEHVLQPLVGGDDCSRDDADGAFVGGADLY